MVAFRRASVWLALVGILCLSTGCSSYMSSVERVRGHVLSGDLEGALEELKPDDNDVLRLMERGLLLSYAGRYEESNRCFDTADLLIETREAGRFGVKARESSSSVARSCGLAWKQLGLLDLGEDRVSEAATELERALESAPRDRDVINALGEALRRLDRTERTIELWRRSLELDPRQPLLRRQLARIEESARGS